MPEVMNLPFTTTLTMSGKRWDVQVERMGPVFQSSRGWLFGPIVAIEVKDDAGRVTRVVPDDVDDAALPLDLIDVVAAIESMRKGGP